MKNWINTWWEWMTDKSMYENWWKLFLSAIAVFLLLIVLSKLLNWLFN